ncbi:MAG: hypothetical protein SW833_21975 [Cyanobacteriota bacterium]|nr:hypothetical protein [Cyanobacteriota bacterium]
MKILNVSKIAVVDDARPKKKWLHTALVIATVTVSSAAKAATMEPLTQYCPEGDVFIPSSKICAITLDTTVNGSPVFVHLDATTYHTGINQVEYNLLNPIVVTIPGLDGDRVTLNQISVFLDPVLKFEASFTDFGEPSPFDVTFTSFPFGSVVSVASSLSGVLTDGSQPKNGVSLATPGLLQYDFLDATNAVVDSFDFGSQVSFAAGPSNGSGDSHLYGPLFVEDSLTCNTVGCGRLQLSLAFTGSGGGDRYNFNSRSDITVLEQVPEPSTAVPIALFGLAGLWFLKKKHLSK